MSRAVAVGFTLQPETAFLELTEALVAEQVELLEVAPETLWRVRRDCAPGTTPAFEPNEFFHAIHALGRRHQLPFVAHGVGWSPGTMPAQADEPRRAMWRQAIAFTHAAFGFGWYTDHLGATRLGGQQLTLPLPVPFSERHAATVAARMAELQQLVPTVGLENTVACFVLGAPLDEPAFLARALAAPGQYVLLDLHNLFTMAHNLGFDPQDWLQRLPLQRVLEIHVSGGRESDPAWLPGGAVMRLDSHDDGVPEPVWTLLEQVVPACTQLRAVVLERMEGTVTDDDVPRLRDELTRIHDVVCRIGR